MACSVEEAGSPRTPRDAHGGGRVTPSFDGSACVVLTNHTRVASAVANAAGTKFRCTVPVPVLGSLTRSLGDRDLFRAISLADECAIFGEHRFAHSQ